MDIITIINNSNKFETVYSVYLVPVKWDNPIMKYKSNCGIYKSFFESIKSLNYCSEKCFAGLNGGDFEAVFEQDIGIVQFDTAESKSKKEKSQYLKIFDKIFSQIIDYNFLKSLNFQNYKDGLKNFVVFKSATTATKYNRTELNLISPYGYFINGKNKNNLTLRECKDSCKQSTQGSIYNFPIVWFDTEEETINCYNSIVNPYISKFVCINTIIDRHTYIYLQNIMPKYDKEYTDKDYCELYGIDGYISEGVGEVGSEYQFIVDFVQSVEIEQNKKLSKQSIKSTFPF
jgi:hypothetical protein